MPRRPRSRPRPSHPSLLVQWHRQRRAGLPTSLTHSPLTQPSLFIPFEQHVHVACLQRWRNTSPNASAFFVCPQCRYHYRFARTKVVGLATNPGSSRPTNQSNPLSVNSASTLRPPPSVAIATLSSVLFTIIVYASSFLTTTLLTSLDDPSYSSYSSSTIYITTGGGYWTWTNPYTVGRDLVRAALRIIQDETGGIFDPDTLLTSPGPASGTAEVTPERGFIGRFVRRFVLGLPVVGAASLIQMLFSLPLLGPIQWIARSRGNRGRGSSGSRDTAAVVIIFLLAIGALR